MKGAIIAFICAVSEFIDNHKNWQNEKVGSISIMLTGDEEGKAVDCLAKMLKLLNSEGEIFSVCLA